MPFPSEDVQKVGATRNGQELRAMVSDARGMQKMSPPDGPGISVPYIASPMPNFAPFSAI
jgi:hypothetical protein